VYYSMLILKRMDIIVVRRNVVGNNLKILCHPICIWLYNPSIFLDLIVRILKSELQKNDTYLTCTKKTI